MAPRKRQKPRSRTVWTSPVLYLGIVLVVVITGLLVAPFVIDWNSYRADLEAYGKKLTGRDVIVEPNVFFGPGVKVADRATIIEKGRIRWEGTMPALQAAPAVREQYLSV